MVAKTTTTTSQMRFWTPRVREEPPKLLSAMLVRE
jgi:hypothetical protein